MGKAGGALLTLALLLSMPALAATGNAPRLALTFDDIPAHGPLPPGVDRLRIIDAIVKALREGHVPAHGFLNAGFGAGDAQSGAVVARWRAAGFPLGNHGYDHLALSKVGAPAFLADVDRNVPPLRAAMAQADWHWLRFPFLDEGAMPSETAAVRTGLRERGYRIAAVTLSFGDYAWNVPYARCTAKGDAATVAGLESSYIAAARADAEVHRALSRRLYGRNIPYVVLMHVGAFDARMLPRLIALYRDMGFRFVPLAKAERDPFYAAATDLARPGPSPTLDATARARGIAVPAAPPLPSQTLCA